MGQGKAKRGLYNLPEERWLCIWCDERPPVVTFRNREHIIAESLGGHRDYRLHRGVVCDRCNGNGGILKTIDDEMVLIGPIRSLRAHFALGPRVVQAIDGIMIDRNADLLTVDAGRLERGTRVTFTGHADRTGTITMTTAGPSQKVRGEHLTRGLHRIAYNALANHLGPEQARDSFRFLRDLVLDLDSIKDRAYLFDEPALLKAMQGPKREWRSNYDVLMDQAGHPEILLVRIGPWPCFISVARTTAPLHRLLKEFPWLKASTRLDEA